MKFYISGPSGVYLDEIVRFDYEKALRLCAKLIKKKDEEPTIIIDGFPFASYIGVDMVKLFGFDYVNIFPHRIVSEKVRVKGQLADLWMFSEATKVGKALNKHHSLFRKLTAKKGVLELYKMGEYTRSLQYLQKIVDVADYMILFESKERKIMELKTLDFPQSIINHKQLNWFSGLSIAEEAEKVSVAEDKWRELRQNKISGNDVMGYLKIMKEINERPRIDGQS